MHIAHDVHRHWHAGHKEESPERMENVLLHIFVESISAHIRPLRISAHAHTNIYVYETQIGRKEKP